MTKNALLKRGPKNPGMGRPPPLIRAMPERKRFFSIDVFPYFHGILLDLPMFCLNCVPSAIEGMIKNASPTRQCASIDLNLDTRFLRTPVPRSAEPDEQGVDATLLHLHTA